MADTTDQASSLHHDHKPSNLHTDYEQTCKALAVLTKEVFTSENKVFLYYLKDKTRTDICVTDSNTVS